MSYLRDDLIGYTKSLVGKNNKLSYTFAKGAFRKYTQKAFKGILAEVDDQLGIDFKYTKKRGKADVIIGHGELPEGAIAAAVWTDVRWEIRLPEGYYSYGSFRHELGHVLGFGHSSQSANSLMTPNETRITDFTKKDIRQLQSIWDI